MEWYDWLLFLHVATAFLLVTGVILAVAVLMEARSDSGSFLLRRVSPLAEMLWNVGGIGVLVFGIWLALHGTPQDYGILDGWIVTAIVLYLIATGAGGPIVKTYREARTGVEGAGHGTAIAAVADGRMVLLHTVLSVATIALLVVMIYKPGAG